MSERSEGNQPSGRSALAPIAQGERLELVDALRGLALFGILLVNVEWFANPLASDFTDQDNPLPLHERAAQSAIAIVAEGKFYSIFSMLFGFGMAMQMGRAQIRGRPFVATYVRRLSALLLIAALHVRLLWFGDILHAYAVLGFGLLLFRNCRQRTLLTLAAISLFGVPALFAGLGGLAWLASLAPEGSAASHPASAEVTSQPVATPSLFDKADVARFFTELLERENQAYRSASFVVAADQRLEDFAVAAGLILTIYPVVFALFLIGLWLARQGALHDPHTNRRGLKRALVIGLLLGVPMNVAGVWLLPAANADDSGVGWLLMAPLTILAGPMLAMAYVSGIALGSLTRIGARASAWLAPAGRMALSNYLMQSLICTTLCNGYGLGLFGRISPLAGIALAVALFAMQVALSRVWLQRYRFGPAEWFWRVLTYGRWHAARAPLEPR